MTAAKVRRNLVQSAALLPRRAMPIVTLITAVVTRRSSGAPSQRAIARDGADPHIGAMEAPSNGRQRKQHPLLRQFFFLLGIVLIIVSPLVGAIPGPGGVVVFAAGLALVLKNSEWAKRQYVRFKRAHPNKGRWADWGMRRPSARRREALHRALAAGSVVEGAREQAQTYPQSPEPIDPPSASGRND